MKTSNLLHLVRKDGGTVPVAIGVAVEAAYQWVLHEFPMIDPALVAGWAEDVGKAMAEREIELESPRRYAFGALHGKVREWFRSGGTREIAVGIGAELEEWAGADKRAQRLIERTVLSEQLKMRLNDRDKHILALYQQDLTSPQAVAEALDITYAAAAKAISRVKERIASILEGDRGRKRATTPGSMDDLGKVGR